MYLHSSLVGMTVLASQGELHLIPQILRVLFRYTLILVQKAGCYKIFLKDRKGERAHKYDSFHSQEPIIYVM